jgi:hypothetical protein
MSCGIGSVLSKPSATNPRAAMNALKRLNTRNRMDSKSLNRNILIKESVTENGPLLTSAQLEIQYIGCMLATARKNRAWMMFLKTRD